MDSERKRSIKVFILGKDGSPSVSLLRAKDSVPAVPEGYVLGEDGCMCPPAPEKQKTCKRRSSCPPDPRFPNQDQTLHCYMSFVDYQKCARLLGDYPGCMIFYECYKNLCPTSWSERWYDQMEKGIFPRKIYPPSPIIRPDPEKMKGICFEGDDEEPVDVC